MIAIIPTFTALVTYCSYHTVFYIYFFFFFSLPPHRRFMPGQRKLMVEKEAGIICYRILQVSQLPVANDRNRGRYIYIQRWLHDHTRGGLN